ncbi:MAG: hypothetical protein AB8G96_09235 [Phycisphaerales bacterium]
MHEERFCHSEYTIRRKVLSILGAKFHVYGPNEQLVLFTKQKAFKLREDIRLYESEAMENELLVLQARQVIDFGVTFDVVDPLDGDRIGSVRRKGLKSILRDEWLIFGADDEPLGRVFEDQASLALLRRIHPIFSVIAPQSHNFEVNGAMAATLRQNRNPFVQKTMVRIEDASAGALDPRLAVGTAVLIAAIEGRQN